MSTIATTIAGPKTYSAEELQALHLAMNAKAKRKKMLQKTALVTMNLIVCLFMLVMATMMVPGEATIISNYLTVGSLGLLDTYIVLILPSLTSAMGIFLFRQFYMTFPVSLYESAKLDGCGNLRFIVKILMPLTKSAMGAMAVYTFINAWNMYMWPLLVTGSDSKRTVQIGISMLNSVDAQSITLMLAGVVMIIIPSISIFIVGQKALIKGMFSGAVKG